MSDPLEKLGDEELYLLAVDLKVQLEKGTGTRPILYLLAKQRERAAMALVGLVDVDPTDTAKIRGFQQEAALYHDLIMHCRELLNRGREADRNIAENERAALAEAVEGMSEEERRALNVEPRGDDE